MPVWKFIMNLETDNKIQKKGITLVIPNPCGNIKETKMKNSGVEWIGEIPDEWEVKPVKRYFSHVKRIVGDDVDKYERLSLTMQGVLKRSKDDAEGLQPEKFNGYQILKQNELVFKLIDLENVNTSRVGISPFNGLVSPAYIILTNNKKDNTFYYYWFLNMYYQEIFNKLGDGGVRSALNASDVLSLPMVYLNNETQQRIASYLDKKCSKIEEIIQKQQQVIEKLKAYKQSLITEAVTGKVKIVNGKACGEYESYKESGVKWIGNIPSGWEVRKAKYFIKISNGSDPKTEEGDTPVYGSGAESFKTCVEFKEGPTVLIGRKGATLHIPHYIEGNYWNVDTAFDVKTYSEEILLLKFYYYCATAFDYRFYLTSTTLPSMTQTNYGNMYLPVPNTLVQKEIVEFLDNKCTAIDTVIEQKQSLIEKLTEYKKSLIYEVVTGKKEI